MSPPPKMGSLEPVQTTSPSSDPNSSPRISFSAEFLDEKNFISISPKSPTEKTEPGKERQRPRNPSEFEFLSSNNLTSQAMLTADELFFEGKLLPFWHMQQAEKLGQISLEDKEVEGKGEEQEVIKEESRMSWFVDDDPSPRPPKCSVLWKELLRLKKQRASSLSPSSSSSSSSSSNSRGDHLPPIAEGIERSGNKHVKRIKRGLERTRSASIRIRPMINVPICTQGKNNSLPPLFPLKKGRLDR